MAKIEFQIKDGNYKVCKFVEEHNHMLSTPSRKHLLRSSKNLSENSKRLIKSWNKSGIKSSQCHNLMATEAGGYDKLGFDEEDIRRYVRNIAKQTYGTDANNMLDYFKNKQAENPAFFYSIQLDESAQLCNCFWVDARARVDYFNFGDAISFDTTYKKNKYLMPFAPFTGVNHHCQSIVFGCSLLVDETEASFIWLFIEWLKAMGNRHPSSIITDQDPAMKAAIAKVFPNTNHRFCLWHILQKVPEKLGHVYREHPTFKSKWDKCIYDTEFPEEFEKNWTEMIEEFNLVNFEWLNIMWAQRQMWMPVFLKGTFFAGMSTTQRSESMNSFFKDWVNKHTTLRDFVEKYDMALQKRRELEIRQDYKSSTEQPIRSSRSKMEKQLSNVFTHKMFKKFQRELIETISCYTKLVEHDGSTKKYEITNDSNMKKKYVVSYVEDEQLAKCTCCKFEFEGIVCQHIFIVFKLEHVLELPARYIMKRWTKDAKYGVVHDVHNVEIKCNAKNTMTMRYNNLMYLANKLVMTGAMYERTHDIVEKIITNGILESEKINREEGLQDKNQGISNIGERDIDVGDDLNVTTVSQHNIRDQAEPTSSITIVDPKIIRAKGSGKRIGRKCRTCHEIGHDSPICSKRKKI
ncbi:hypothetical protein HHK36_006091 [Tetracentron sinense]|uniref:SWIM-type domain-containing protein n=1 Tax=Tetracentron sinense TaxID=13715 RepID=A0A834ZGK6_TETSI|nr:hypothetical protein HHK36_006091 [Tetracentron sinense]